MRFGELHIDQIKAWCRRDAWTVQEAMSLISELNPERSIEARQLMLGGGQGDFDVFDAERKRNELLDTWARSALFAQQRGELYAPSYFLDWAKQHGFEIRWLEFVDEPPKPSTHTTANLSQLLEFTDECDLPPTSLENAVREVKNQFWATYDDKAVGAKPPTQAQIINWLKSKHGLNEIQAKAVEKVACPINRDPAKKHQSIQGKNSA